MLDVCFDQLALDPVLQPYFGRPDVTVADMLGFTEFSLAELQRHCAFSHGLSPGDTLHPCLRVWPMGFAWSSFLAQSTLLACLAGANFGPDHLIADDKPPPLDPRTAPFAYAACGTRSESYSGFYRFSGLPGSAPSSSART